MLFLETCLKKCYMNLEKNINNNNLKAIFLEGTGDAFCAGGDVKDMASREDNSTLTEKTENLKKVNANFRYNI